MASKGGKPLDVQPGRKDPAVPLHPLLLLLCKPASNDMVITSKSTSLFAVDEEEYNAIYVLFTRSRFLTSSEWDL
jgi:hypothetical protein